MENTIRTSMGRWYRDWIRQSYLRSCLREYERAYRDGAYRTREEYLAARRAERQTHYQNWREQDSSTNQTN